MDGSQASATFSGFEFDVFTCYTLCPTKPNTDACPMSMVVSGSGWEKLDSGARRAWVVVAIFSAVLNQGYRCDHGLS